MAATEKGLLKFCAIIIICLLENAVATLPKYTPALRHSIEGRDALIRSYFHQGYAYKEIVLFLTTLHGIKIGYEYLRHVVRKLGLRRKKIYDDATLQSVIDAIREECKGSGKIL